MLYLTRVPDNLGGDTLFANLQAAFEELSPELQQYLMQQSAFHDGELDLMRYGIRLKPGQSYPAHTHPVVIQHPKTEKPVLYVNEGFTAHLFKRAVLRERLDSARAFSTHQNQRKTPVPH